MVGIEKKIGYTFKNKELLTVALTHSSYANEHKLRDNERLEFLGDSVLSVVISEHIFKKLMDVKEGDLSKYRSVLVCENSLANLARKISLPDYIMLGNGEKASGGSQRPSILSDAFEALVAAIFLDAGMKFVKQWILNLMHGDIDYVLSGKGYGDYKSMLQEKVQKGDKGKVTYELIGTSGAEHNKSFSVEALIDGEVMARGRGRTKKEAEQRAARLTLKKLRKLSENEKGDTEDEDI